MKTSCKSYNFKDYGLEFMKTTNSKSQKITILHEINNKKKILNAEMSAL